MASAQWGHSSCQREYARALVPAGVRATLGVHSYGLLASMCNTAAARVFDAAIVMARLAATKGADANADDHSSTEDLHYMR
jgi:hypothetical protein